MPLSDGSLSNLPAMLFQTRKLRDRCEVNKVIVGIIFLKSEDDGLDFNKPEHSDIYIVIGIFVMYISVSSLLNMSISSIL